MNLRVLWDPKEVDRAACEDMWRTRFLLNQFTMSMFQSY